MARRFFGRRRRSRRSSCRAHRDDARTAHAARSSDFFASDANDGSSMLEGLFDDCASESQPKVALVTAAAGAGKSRIRYELVSRLGSARRTAACSRRALRPDERGCAVRRARRRDSSRSGHHERRRRRHAAQANRRIHPQERDVRSRDRKPRSSEKCAAYDFPTSRSKCSAPRAATRG